jgi:16S rRNA processing protein RimM
LKSQTPQWVAVAHILRARGNKGEVAAEILTDFPERLTKLKAVYLSDGLGKAEPRSIGVKACWLSQNHSGQAVFHFEGSASISDADKFRGLDVLIPIEQRVKLPVGRHFVSDLVGCSVFELSAQSSSVASSPCSLAEAPSLLGIVREVEFTGSAPLLVVDTASGEILIPMAEDICTRIDTTARRIEVVLPPGLRELNS